MVSRVADFDVRARPAAPDTLDLDLVESDDAVRTA
jgi:hypothetical protein